MKRVFILDTGAFLSGLSMENGEFCTIQEVIDELRDRGARLRAEVGIDEGKLAVAPSPDPGKVREAAAETGDIASLSETDLKILSLGLRYREKGCDPVIVTDDYSIQNVAKKLGLDFAPITERGIKRGLVWRKLCRGCGRVYPTDFTGSCTFCGSPVKRRIYRGSRK